MYRRNCGRCCQKLRTDENYLKAHLWASTAVFHWSCLGSDEGAWLRSCRGRYVEGKQRFERALTKAPCRGSYPRHGAQQEVYSCRSTKLWSSAILGKTRRSGTRRLACLSQISQSRPTRPTSTKRVSAKSALNGTGSWSSESWA